MSSLQSTTNSYATAIESYYSNWSITKQKIDDEYTLSKEQNSEIADLITKISELKEQLTTEAARSSELLDEARETLNIVTNASLSSVFSKRSEERRTARRWWTFAVFMAVASFLGAIYYAITHIQVNSMSDWSVWLLRLTLITPFVYLIYFVTSQYNHERDLEERYAFKSLIAQTLQNYAKVLNDEFIDESNASDVQPKILDFTIESMKSVYKEPHKNVLNTETRLRFNPKSAQTEAEAKSVEVEKG